MSATAVEIQKSLASVRRSTVTLALVSVVQLLSPFCSSPFRKG